MKNDSVYLEKSSAGEWIALARIWLEDHGPISLKEYLGSIRRYMPTFIAKNSKGDRYTQRGLALEALKRVAKQDENGLWYVEKKNVVQKGYVNDIVDCAKRNATVSKKDFPEMKNFGSLVSQLTKRGILIRTSPGVYVLRQAKQIDDFNGDA